MQGLLFFWLYKENIMIHPGEKFCSCVQHHAGPVLLRKLYPSKGRKKIYLVGISKVVS